MGNTTYDINENVQRLAGPLLHELRRVVLGPVRFFGVRVAEVAGEGLLAPGAGEGVGDGGVGGYGFVFGGVFEELGWEGGGVGLVGGDLDEGGREVGRGGFGEVGNFFLLFLYNFDDCDREGGFGSMGRKGEGRGGALTQVKAPWPPMLCPKMLTRCPSTCVKCSKTVRGSSAVM